MARSNSGANSAATSGSDVGKETLAYCTSCKMDLNHVVVAMKGDRVAKAQCLTCKKEHVYRAPKGVTTPPAKKSKKKESAEKEIQSIEAEWEKLMATHKDAPVKTYNMKGQYGLGDRLNHPSFGEGIVNRLIYPNKLEVIFRTDAKVLICGSTVHATK